MMLRDRCLPTIEWLEYIEGLITHQYIDTGQAANFSGAKIECDWMLRRLDSTHKSYLAIFGNYVNESSPCVRLILGTSATTYYGNCNWTASSAKTMTSLALATRHSMTMTPSIITVDGTSYSSSGNTLTYTNSQTVKIMSTRDSVDQTVSNHALRIYKFRILNGTTVLRDLWPCRISGAVGMYDKANGKFYGNSGVGSFTAGPKA